MSDIKSIIRLNCDEELDIKYFTKDEYITDRTIDYSELLEYINEIEDKNERLENIIKEVREYIEENTKSDSSIELTSGKITDIGYCIVAFEDILGILDKVGDEISK